jgi:hypothetical protein
VLSLRSGVLLWPALLTPETKVELTLFAHADAFIPAHHGTRQLCNQTQVEPQACKWLRCSALLYSPDGGGVEFVSIPGALRLADAGRYLQTGAHKGRERLLDVRHSVAEHHFEYVNLGRPPALVRVQSMARVGVAGVDLLFAVQMRHFATTVVAPRPHVLTT